jgi:outer membrane protein OmpA-like peptidoglycan-associated protein
VDGVVRGHDHHHDVVFRDHVRPGDGPQRRQEGGASGRQFGRANLPAVGDQAGLGGSVYFDELAVDPSDGQKANLKRIADAMAGKPQKIEVLGHATRRPLPPDCPYRDPWDLAYGRCRRITELLVSSGIDPQRIRMGVAQDSMPGRTLASTSTCWTSW